MNGKDLVVLGKLGAVYGINGWLKVNSYTDDPEGIFSYKPWQIQSQGQWRQVVITSWKRHSNGLIVKLDGVNDRDQAQLLVNAEIAVTQTNLPKLEDLMETGSNDVLVVKANKTDAFGQKERLIPFLTDSVIKNVDLTQGRIIVDWDPEF